MGKLTEEAALAEYQRELLAMQSEFGVKSSIGRGYGIDYFSYIIPDSRLAVFDAWMTTHPVVVQQKPARRYLLCCLNDILLKEAIPLYFVR